MIEAKDKIGISMRTSILLIIFGLIITFFPRNILPSLIYTLGNGLYFYGTMGLFLNITSKKLKIKRQFLTILLSFVLSIGIMIITYQIYNYISILNYNELKSNSITTNAFVKNVTTTTSPRGRKSNYIDLEFLANGKLYNVSIAIGKESLEYHEINDTVIIKYSKNNPYNFEIVENRNKRLQENGKKYFDLMTK